MSYIPDQGDLIYLDFDPSSGKEIVKRRPAIVISKREFNRHVGLAIVAPITSTIRGVKLEVALPAECKTKGAVLVYQLKSIDFKNRKAEYIEQAPLALTERVLSIARVLIS